eukprot:CAMPEP_0113992918 /NCGR_PEP_ID=MMETSP0328-20130328/9859_1 /TAXON_ID=39455 /ORGANISM="Alexandrium minutum" /LENGTH=41 /assembly_acc=CAM_ASM_000350
MTTLLATIWVGMPRRDERIGVPDTNAACITKQHAKAARHKG